MNRLEKVREMFSHDRFISGIGAVIEDVDDRYACVSLVINDNHRNMEGNIMGGVYFTLADFAFGVAANWQVQGTVSVSSDISFLSVPRSEKIYAKTRLIRDGKTMCCYGISITDELGNAVAEVKTVGYHKNA